MANTINNFMSPAPTLNFKRMGETRRMIRVMRK